MGKAKIIEEEAPVDKKALKVSDHPRASSAWRHTPPACPLAKRATANRASIPKQRPLAGSFGGATGC